MWTRSVGGGEHGAVGVEASHELGLQTGVGEAQVTAEADQRRLEGRVQVEVAQALLRGGRHRDQGARFEKTRTLRKHKEAALWLVRYRSARDHVLSTRRGRIEGVHHLLCFNRN